MGNLLLFNRINASAATPHWEVAAALLLAQWLIWLVPAGLIVAWIRADRADHANLIEMLVAVLLALGIGQLIGLLWPEPRPFVLHLGSQFLAHAPDPGMPSDHVLVFWSLAASSLASMRHRACALVLFALGLLVGWSRVFVGVHFPFDVLGALPVAGIAAVIAHLLRLLMAPAFTWPGRIWDELFRRRSVE